MNTFKQFYLENAPKEGDVRSAYEGDETVHYKYTHGKWVLHSYNDMPIERENGDLEWYSEGILHRIGKPAQIKANGVKCWYVAGKRHRMNGPAIEWPGGGGAWYINDRPVDGAELLRRKVRIGQVEPSNTDWGWML